MKSSKYIIILTTILTFALCFSEINAQDFDLKIKGSIIMYSRFSPGSFFNMCGSASTFVVKISKIVDGKESAEYILMATNHSFDKKEFDAKKNLQFNLLRIPAFDEKVTNLIYLDTQKSIPLLLLSKEAKLEEIPLDETLPAYLFLGNKYAAKNWKKKV